MSHPNRPGFTWVELVVVLLVVGLGLAVLVVMLNEGRCGPHRRATCVNNQCQVGRAILQRESYKGFPGYVNRIGTHPDGSHIVASWVVSVLPHLEQCTLSETWRSGKASQDADGDGIADGYMYLRLLVCPSDPAVQQTPGSTPLSYVVNCGRPGDSDTLADGVCFNHDVDAEPPTMSLDYLTTHDGASYTVLLSENIQAGRWTDTTEANLGMVWSRSPGPCSRINQCSDASDRPQDLKYARPSSHHPGGVVASFCDGHTIFLSDQVDYRVYQHLMIPDSSAAGVPGQFNEDDL